jgi:lipid-binding SYLF domain-containing protein
MSNEHEADRACLNFIKEMVGESFEIRPPESAADRMESQRILSNPANRPHQLIIKIVLEPGRNIVIIAKYFQYVLTGRWMVNYFHCLRT